MLGFILDCLFPKFCCGCSRIGTYVCDNCYENLEFYFKPLSLKLPNQHLSEVRASVRYEEPIKTLLHELKYQEVKNLAKWCGTFLYFTTYIPPADFITSVPIHPRKKRDRGYNQSEEIAVQLARHLQLPYQPLLIKSTFTSAQASTKSKTDRLSHVAGSFSLHPSVMRNSQLLTQYQGKSVLIIDDVITTGATVNTCAEVLLAYGFGKVSCLAVAHGF